MLLNSATSDSYTVREAKEISQLERLGTFGAYEECLMNSHLREQGIWAPKMGCISNEDYSSSDVALRVPLTTLRTSPCRDHLESIMMAHNTPWCCDHSRCLSVVASTTSGLWQERMQIPSWQIVMDQLSHSFGRSVTLTRSLSSGCIWKLRGTSSNPETPNTARISLNLIPNLSWHRGASSQFFIGRNVFT